MEIIHLHERLGHAVRKRQAAEFLQGVEVAGGPGQVAVLGFALSGLATDGAGR